MLPMTSLNLVSHVCETRTFVMAILHRKQGLLCDKSVSHYSVKITFICPFPNYSELFIYFVLQLCLLLERRRDSDVSRPTLLGHENGPAFRFFFLLSPYYEK